MIESVIAISKDKPLKPFNRTEHIVQNIKLRRIEAVTIDSADTSSKLRSTWLGKYYAKHLKGYSSIRSVVHWMWRYGYPVFVRVKRAAYFFIASVHGVLLLLPDPRGETGSAYRSLSVYRSRVHSMRWRRLSQLRNYVTQAGIQTYTLAEAASVETPAPKVFPCSDQGLLKSPHDHYTFPEIYVATLTNAIAYGGTNLILLGDEVICHDLYDFERDSTSEELHGRALISPQSNRIRWLMHDELPEVIPVAATFIDACAANYAHWMSEVLPRIALFCSNKRFKDVPIVVNDGLHQNIMDSLFLVAGAEREIITVPVGRAVAVSALYLTSVAGYVPFGRRSTKLSDHSDGIFNTQALVEIREIMNAPPAGDGKKIYIRRNSGVRKVINNDDIEALLVSRGFLVIEPEKMSLNEQVKLFSNAKIVVSPTGAALANAIFCMPGAHVVVLMGCHKDMIYRYWSNMLSGLQINVSYVLGQIVSKGDIGIHGDVYIDIASVEDSLDAMKD